MSGTERLIFFFPSKRTKEHQMKTPGHRFKNKTKRIACSESCTVEVLTARYWGFNTFSESLRGGTVTEGKFTHVVHQQIPSRFWKSLFCKWLQIRWGNCENSCPFLILTRHPLWHCQREYLAGQTFVWVRAASTFSYRVLQWMSLSCGTGQTEPGLKACWHVPGWRKRPLWIKGPGR